MWLKPQGYATIVSPNESRADLDHIRSDAVRVGTNEYDTCTCGHCNFVFHVGARQRPEDIGGLCKQCMRPICPRCLDKGCTPFEKQLEIWEERDRFRRSIG